MSELKTRENDASVEDFLKNIPDDTRRSDSLTLAALMQQVTGVEPRMWGDAIVGYGSVRYRYASGREGDWMPVGFSPRKGQLSLYLFCEYQKHPAMQRLGKYKLGAGCLYIKKLADVDTAALVELIHYAWENGGKAVAS